MRYRCNRLDEPVFIALSKPLLTEFGIHHRLESCAYLSLELAPSGHCKTLSLPMSCSAYRGPFLTEVKTSLRPPELLSSATAELAPGRQGMQVKS